MLGVKATVCRLSQTVPFFACLTRSAARASASISFLIPGVLAPLPAIVTCGMSSVLRSKTNASSEARTSQGSLIGRRKGNSVATKDWYSGDVCLRVQNELHMCGLTERRAREGVGGIALAKRRVALWRR